MDGSPRLMAALRFALSMLAPTLVHVRRTPGLALTSLLIGCALWLVVTAEENPTRIDLVSAPISLEAANTAPQLAVANALPSLQIRVSAPIERWNGLTADNFRAFVDLNGLEARQHQVPVRVEVVGITQVRVLETVPPSVTVNLEELQTKSVRVVPRIVGTLPRGYDLGSTIPDRSSVDVSGPKSLVGLVSEAAATVNVTGLTVGLDQVVALTPVAEGGGEIRGIAVRPATARVAIAVRQDVLTRTLPLEVELGGQPAPGYRVAGVRVTPQLVRVEGAIDVLQSLDTLRLPRVDVSGQQADLRATIRITPPVGMVATVPSAVVEVTIVVVPGSVTLNIAPEVVNLRAGLTARVSSGSVAVFIEGPIPRLNALPAGVVRATVNGSNLNPGVTEVRVAVTLPDGVTLREVQPATVSVIVSRS